MEIKPLKTYKTPTYPDKSVISRNPNILKTLPERWKGNAKVGIALSSVIMLMLTSCGAHNDLKTKEGEVEEGSALIAPIFIHGDGRGSFGCESVAPPAFLSEEEAFEIISEEAKREGIILTRNGLTLNNIDMPLTSLFYDPDEVELRSQNGSLKLDGYDKNKMIAYEFISREDIIKWKDEENLNWSSVDDYDSLGTAKRLREGLKGKTEDNTVAIFYDPMGFEEDIYSEYSEAINKIFEDEELSDEEKNQQFSEVIQKYTDQITEIRQTMLREQVRDFLDWLKAQGII